MTESQPQTCFAKDFIIRVKNEFSRMEESSSVDQLKKDLLSILKYNYPNPKSDTALNLMEINDLKYFCCHGIMLGAIRTTCISCGGILCPEAINKFNVYSYKCLNKAGPRKLGCRNDKYYLVKLSSWRIPTDQQLVLENPNMRQVMDHFMNEVEQKYIRPPIIYYMALIASVGTKIDEHINPNSMIIENQQYEIYKKEDGGITKFYSYFAINTPDCSDGKYCLCQILIPKRTLHSKCLLRRDEVIYETKGMHDTKKMTIEKATEEFEEKFRANTGMDWPSWCRLCTQGGSDIDRHCRYNNNYMLPLKINYQDGTIPELEHMLQY